MGVSMLSTTGGEELHRSTFSVLGETSGVASSNVSRNTSEGSSVIDVPRETGHHNSILNSFIREEQPSKLESFSRPPIPAPRSRVTSEGAASNGGPDETFDMKPPPAEPPTPSAHHYYHHQHQQHLQHHSLLQERAARSTAANGSILRSKSAAAIEPQFATPAVSRSNGILSGLMPRTPGFGQTPSMHRHSLSALSLASTQRIIVNDKEYAILNQIGKGGSSQVYKAFDDITGDTVAIKVVDLSDTDPSSREAFINEVELLDKLQGSRYVIKLFDYEVDENQLVVVMEKGEQDLGSYLKNRRMETTPTFLKYWWEAMLQAVQFVHDHKVVHMDLKPANFLLVSADLKLIDFGIASSIPSDKTSLLKDTQMGTLSYMSPESLSAAENDEEEGESKFKVTAKSDVWSLGCILYTMVYGKRPFDQFKNTRAKMGAIQDPSTRIHYDPTDDPMIVDVLKRCLVYDVKKRASVAELLEHPYLKASSSSVARPSTVSTPSRCSPISDESLALLAAKIQSCTPRTVQRKLKELVVTAQSKRPTPKLPTLDLDSPPSTN
ncbi:hypothetical protein PRIPAC_74896 [Pristionchus pacificus]|nr:hypothetical protein PRIPAC_74896 [Pristionchus pacificus]